MLIEAKIITLSDVLNMNREIVKKIISGEEHFSSKKCLAWFYEYAGNEINIRRYQSHALKLFFFGSFI